MAPVQNCREVKGIDYPYPEKISAYMFTETGLTRQRLLGGRGRDPEVVNVHYDSRYPVDLINQILDDVLKAMGDGEQYTQWLIENKVFESPSKPSDEKTKLLAIQHLIDVYATGNTTSPRWDKSNKVIAELKLVMGENHD